MSSILLFFISHLSFIQMNYQSNQKIDLSLTLFGIVFSHIFVYKQDAQYDKFYENLALPMHMFFIPV